VAARGLPPRSSPSGPVLTAERPAVPSKVHNPAAADGGSICKRASSAVVTSASPGMD
jgi:hypothetical protein